MFKCSLITTLTIEILLQGCTQGEIITMRPPADKQVWFLLEDGRIITTDPYHHVNVVEPAEFVFVVGVEYDNNGSTPPWRSSVAIPPDVYDSTRAASRSAGMSVPDSVQFQTSDTTYVVFSTGDVIRVSEVEGNAFWCIGRVETDGREDPFSGRITYGEIKEIRAEKEPVGKAITTGVVSAVGVYSVIALVVLGTVIVWQSAWK